MIEPADRHFVIFSSLARQTKATANLISDTYLAAIAIEHGCTLLTADSDFRKFPNLPCEFL
jgi:predicted nucleic acid-binding protein